MKCNVHELAAATGTGTLEDGLAALFAAGASRALVTLGADGMVLASPGSSMRARLPQAVAGNPTGAGDSALAPIAAAWGDGDEATLVRAVAVCAASVLQPVAGAVDPADAAHLLPSVILDRL